METAADGQMMGTMGLTQADVIHALTTEYINVYGLDLNTDRVTVYRFANQAVGVLEQMDRFNDYNEITESYIRQNVLPEDQDMLRQQMKKENLIKELSDKSVFAAHYRVRRQNEQLHYYFMKCVRLGSPDQFSNVILAFANEDAAVIQAGTHMPIPGDAGSARRVLIVEPDAGVRQELRELLAGQYDILEAESCRAGLEMLRENCRDVSLVILRAEPDEAQCIQFLKTVREQGGSMELPILILSDGTGDREDEYLELGAAEFLYLPLRRAGTLKRIADIIRLSESSAALQAIEYDDLTGVYTRKAFFHYAESLLRRNPEIQYDMVLSDIESFRRVNDRYGSDMGDEILRILGRNMVRKEPEMICGRFGGDRFVSISRHREMAQADQLAAFQNEVGAQFPIPGVVVKFAIYENVEHNLPITVICDRLLTVLRTIKHQYGKNYAMYDNSLKVKAEKALLIEECMQRALDEHQFQVYYQPKINLHDNNTIGAEALVRWVHPEYGNMNLGDFIPLFEKNGFISSMDRYVWTQVCADMAELRSMGKPVVPVSLNISRRDFDDAGLADWIIGMVDSFGLEHSLIHFEITESSTAEDPRQVTECINRLHDAGFLIELDDFGTGYSTLASLNSMHLDYLKLDRSILNHDMPGADGSILEFAINLAKIMKLKIVQEGVETQTQMERVRELGCDYGQGYFYSRPLSMDQFQEYLSIEKNR